MTATLETVETPAARTKSVWKPLAAAGIGGAVLVATGFGVFAQLNAEAFNAPQLVNSGDLKLVLATDSNDAGTASAGFTQPIMNLAPADTVTRLVSLTNTGSLDAADLRLTVADTRTPASLLSTDDQRGLQIKVENCAVAWTSTPGVGAAAPTCQPGATVAVADRALAGFTSRPVTALTTAGSVNHLLVTVRLPGQTELSTNGAPATPTVGTGSIQQLNADLVFTFTETQRDARNTNS